MVDTGLPSWSSAQRREWGRCGKSDTPHSVQFQCVTHCLISYLTKPLYSWGCEGLDKGPVFVSYFSYIKPRPHNVVGAFLEYQRPRQQRGLRVSGRAIIVANFLMTIKSAYRALAMETHPDRGGTDAAFHRVQTAYNALTM
jgi:hypothetical protein